MIAREICSRIENGQLCVTGGWEGIRNGMMDTKSLSEGYDAPNTGCRC